MNEVDRPQLTDKTITHMTVEQEFLTAQQVGELLQIHHKTVYDLARRGDLPSVKIGGSRRFPRKALMEVLNGQAQTVEPLPSIHELHS